jgi:hypothetical protein
MKKYKLPSDELLNLLLNKQLEPYNITVEDLMKLPEGKINGVWWYEYYTFKTVEDYNIWKNFCVDILRNHTTPKLDKRRIEKEFSMLDLMWGLKHE